MYAETLQSYPTLCNPTDCGLPGSSVCEILQARLQEWVAMPSSRDLPNPGTKPESLVSPAVAGGFFTISAICEPPFRHKEVTKPSIEKVGLGTRHVGEGD